MTPSITPNSPPMTPTSLSLRSGRGWWWGLGGMVGGEGDGRMTLEPCIGCGRMVLTHKIANLTVKCDPSPLDGQGVAQELGAGRQIWSPSLDGRSLKGARPGDAKLLREHSCTAAGALRTPPPVPGAASAPKGRETGTQPLVVPSTPSSAPWTAPSGAPAAVSPRSDLTHPCSLCGHPIDAADVETYALIELGATVIDAFHTSGCRP
jgi:hypothetical protein